MKIHQRHMLRSNDIKDLKEEVKQEYGSENANAIFKKKSNVELIKLEDRQELIAVNNKLAFWKKDNRYIPLLTILIEPDIGFNMKYVTVDKGAIRFVTNGADIMRPGITEIDPSIRKGDLVRVQDEMHNQALAVGKAKFDAEEMEKMETGKVIDNIHTITDDIWEFSKTF